MSDDKKNEMFELNDDQVEQVTGGHQDGGASGSEVGEDPKVPECQNVVLVTDIIFSQPAQQEKVRG